MKIFICNQLCYIDIDPIVADAERLVPIDDKDGARMFDEGEKYSCFICMDFTGSFTIV